MKVGRPSESYSCLVIWEKDVPRTLAIARRTEKAHLNPSSALSNGTEPYFNRKKVFSQFVILTEDEASFCQEKPVEICPYAFEQFGEKKKIIFLKKLPPPKTIYAFGSTKL